MNDMLWAEEVIEKIILLLIYYFPWFNKINFSIFDNEMYQRNNCIKSDIWTDVILLVSISLFCDQGSKCESLEERRKIM